MQKAVWWIVAIIIIAGGLLFWNSKQDGTTPTAPDTDTSAAQEQTVPQDQSAPGQNGTGATADINVSASVGMPAVITYNGTNFSPATLTIRKGDSVAWNSASGSMWIASAPHPAHSGYDGTNLGQHCAAGYSGPAPFDECASGANYTFTFNKAGTWKYHNHLDAKAFGSITVE